MHSSEQSIHWRALSLPCSQLCQLVANDSVIRQSSVNDNELGRSLTDKVIQLAKECKNAREWKKEISINSVKSMDKSRLSKHLGGLDCASLMSEYVHSNHGCPYNARPNIHSPH